MIVKTALILLALIAFCTLAIGQEHTASYWLQKGDEYYDKGSYDLAESCYSKVLELDSKNISALYKKGLVLSYLHNYNESNAAFNTAIKLAPENAHVWNAKGLALWAIAKYNENLEIQLADPTDKNISITKLEGSVENKKIWEYKFNVTPKIKTIYAELNKRDKNSSELLFLFENTYGEPADAALGTGNLGPLEVIAPESGLWNVKVYGYDVLLNGAAFNINLITKSYPLHNYDESMEAYDKAVSLNPLWTTPMNLKALDLYESGKLNDAMNIVNNSTKIDPLNSKTWCLRGVILQGTGNYKDAKKYYNISNELNSLSVNTSPYNIAIIPPIADL